MSVYIDRKYLGMVSHKLELYKQKNNDLFNFRCPFCLDSKKNRTKARGYIYRKGNDYYFRCHNCSVSITFGNFLKTIDQSSYKAYVLERYAAGDNGHSNYKKPTFDELKGNAFEKLANKFSVSIETIDSLPDEHYAKDYIRNRSIPVAFWGEIYYTDNFKDFMDRDFPDHGKDDLPTDDRIVLLYMNEAGEVTNVAGRALGDTKLRYLTVKVTDEKKLFGLQRLSRKDRVYVVEGQFDSFFLPNCLASGDSNLGSVPEYLGGCDCVLIFDNEPRNKDIVRQIGKAVDAGYQVVIWPSDVEFKDINDMAVSGYDYRTTIENNIYKGPAAKLKFMSWKRC